MSDVVTSESSDVNGSSSSSIDATTAETGIGSLAAQVSAANPVIMRVAMMLTLAIINLGGNGFTLITIQQTPRLWTKTNFILASMLVSDCITGVFMFWYTPFLLVVYVFSNPCNYTVAITVSQRLLMMPGFVSACHLILIPVERYIAIVYPLHYEIMFTDRTLKWSIFACWVSGILWAMMWLLGLINADLSKCDPQSPTLDVVVVYTVVCITMFICYGKILVISWRHRQRIEPLIANPAPGTSDNATATTTTKHSTTNNLEETSPGNTEPPASPAVASGAASASLAEQQRQKIKSRRREFKAVYLTGAIVGAFVLLWFPNVLSRVLAQLAYKPVVIDYLYLAGGALGTCNFALSWAIHAAVSKKYRRAYRQMLNRIGCYCCKNVTLHTDNSLTV